MSFPCILFFYKGTYINGWYVRDFLGKTGSVDFHALKSGVNAVPLTITDGCRYIHHTGSCSNCVKQLFLQRRRGGPSGRCDGVQGGGEGDRPGDQHQLPQREGGPGMGAAHEAGGCLQMNVTECL